MNKAFWRLFPVLVIVCLFWCSTASAWDLFCANKKDIFYCIPYQNGSYGSNVGTIEYELHVDWSTGQCIGAFAVSPAQWAQKCNSTYSPCQNNCRACWAGEYSGDGSPYPSKCYDSNGTYYFQ